MSGGVWLLVNSGSRGLGSAVAAHHPNAAEAAGLGDVPGLPLDSDPGRACLGDILWAIEFAAANREALLSAAAEVVEQVAGSPPDSASRINVHHNLVDEEEHLGRTLWVHRKGAIAAPAGARVLIPGSMGPRPAVAPRLRPRARQERGRGAVPARGKRPPRPRRRLRGSEDRALLPERPPAHVRELAGRGGRAALPDRPSDGPEGHADAGAGLRPADA